MLPYLVAILTGSFLLFSVQPMIARIILPWFGGSAAVWTTCLLFFQGMLLLGYLYAFGIIRKLRPRQQGVVHLVLMGVSLVFQHVMPDPSWRPQGDVVPETRILALLMASIGLPYLVLSTTSPLLQAWVARTHRGVVPYRLFALSNLGSLLALVSYPVWVEPKLDIRFQTGSWLALYCVYIGVSAWVTVRACLVRDVVVEDAPPVEGAKEEVYCEPGSSNQFLWVAAAGLASVLLMAVSTHLTQNIAPVPLLWILPLGLYLLSFILCFEGHGLYWRAFYMPLLVVCVWLCAWTLTGADVNVPFGIQVPLYATTLFAACMVCHGEVALRRPPVHHLTGFYLAISTGGVLGGAFVALVAPRIFSDYYELHLGLLACLVLIVVVLAGLAVAAGGVRRWALGAASLLVVVSLCLVARTLWTGTQRDSGATRAAMRNFYGSLRVMSKATSHGVARFLLHGTIGHGLQFLDPEKSRWPTTYFSKNSGVGVALLNCRRSSPQKVGMVGLGVGTIAAYGREGDDYRIYELNPDVVFLAESCFSYLSDCQATKHMVLGDGRLSLEHEAPNGFDVLAVDAFNGDAIPVHLLTEEAFSQYFRHLKPDGVLAVHVSNRYLDLVPIVFLAAASLHKQARLVVYSPPETATGGEAFCQWVLVSGDPAFFQQPAVAAVARPFTPPPGMKAWTDNASNLYEILRVESLRDTWASFWRSLFQGNAGSAATSGG